MHNVDKKKIQLVNLQPIFTGYVFELLSKVRREIEDQLFAIYVTSPESASEIWRLSAENIIRNLFSFHESIYTDDGI